MLTRALTYLRELSRRRRAGSEADEELAFHIEKETRANVARGMSDVEARRVALRDFGGVTQTHEAVGDVRAVSIDALVRDVTYGVRTLVASPRFSLIALATIALMIAGTTTVYTLVQGVLLRPLPYPHAGRLVVVESVAPKRFGTAVTLTDFLAFERTSRSFEMWGLYRTGYVTSIATDAEPMSVQDMRVTPNLFALLGIEVTMGRPLVPADGAPGAPDVAVIGYDLWQSRFGGATDVLGRTIAVRDRTYAVVGVAVPGADVPGNWLKYPIVWRPVREATDVSLQFRTLGRLRPDVSLAQARAELGAVTAGIAAGHPETHKDQTTVATRLVDQIVGDYQRVLWIFFGAVTCVLLIGVANLVSLQMVRNAARAREMSLRAALGAGKWRLVRQLVAEAVVLSVVGGAAGLAIAWAAVRILLATLPADFPRADQVVVDGGVWSFAAALSLLVGLAVGLGPALRASRAGLAVRIHDGGRSATISHARGRLQRALIAFETAAALVLLIGASLLANSFDRLLGRDAGMREEGLWAVTASLPSRVQNATAQREFWTAALEEIRKLPGVESVGASVNSSTPLSGSDMLEGGVVPESAALDARDKGLRVSARRISGDYFRAIGMPVLRGRPILDSDDDASEGVVVVNELVAAALWPGTDPIGKRLKSLGTPKRVIGVIANHRHARLDSEAAPQMYLSYRQQQGIASSSVFMVRAREGAESLPAAVTAVLSGLEKDIKITTATMADVRWRQVASERFRTVLLLVFAASAVFLALVGIFGLVAYTVGERRREIAVRVALGATTGNVVGVVLRQALVPAGIGLAAGVPASVAATTLIASFLVDIKPTDPPTFAAAVTVLALATLAAALVPARQVLGIQPVESLRQE